MLFRLFSAFMSARRKRLPTMAAGAAILLLMAGVSLVSLHYRTVLMRDAQTRTTRLSFLLAEQVARTFEAVDITLRGFEPLLGSPGPALATGDLDALLGRRASELSVVQNMRIMDLNGAVLASSDPGASGSASGRDGCLAALSRPDAPPLAIGCESGDVGPGGRPTIAVARRLAVADGQPARIIVADVDPADLSKFFRDLELGSGSIVTLTEDHGHTLLASAAPEGADRGAPALIQPTERVQLDALQRASRDKITAAQAVTGYPLSVTVAIDRGTLNRQWRQAITPAALLGVALSGLLVFVARSFERHRAEREQARQRAMMAQKLEVMGQMTASVAHDFRNILTVMGGSLRLIRRRGVEAAVLDEADGTIERGNAMVDRLLAFSRRGDLRPEPYDVNDLLRHLAGTLRHVAGPDTTLLLDLDDGIDLCQVDRSQFDAALMNLVVNARQAMTDVGTVTVRSRPGSGGAAITVADTGCGIDAAILKRIFEPFFTTKADGGTGLGLAQVQFFVEQIGGAVTVESTVGVGTAVTLHLPRAAVRPGGTAPVPVLTLDPA